MARAQKSFRTGKAAVAALLIGLVLLLDAMAACHDLHELIHRDAGKADHDCAVTMFSHGKVDSTIVEVLPVVAPAPIETTSRIQLSLFTAAPENLLSGRAPPAVSSSIV
jgi:hypothetical protein